jgi:AcrR family transcriptional regulator
MQHALRQSSRSGPTKSPGPSPRERILQTATELFYRHGIHSVGIDRIIAESGVAKMTFYRHFPSKVRLIEEYLAQNELKWQSLLGQVTGAAQGPAEKLLAIFDGLECAIKDPGFCGCPFIKALAEFGLEQSEPEVRTLIARHFSQIEDIIVPLLKQARPKDSKKLLPALMSLITGTVVVAQATGKTDVAKLNKTAAQTLLEAAPL